MASADLNVRVHIDAEALERDVTAAINAIHRAYEKQRLAELPLEAIIASAAVIAATPKKVSRRGLFGLSWLRRQK